MKCPKCGRTFNLSAQTIASPDINIIYVYCAGHNDYVKVSELE